MAASLKVHQPALKSYIKDELLTLEEVEALRALLVEKKTLNLAAGKIPESGLYSAAMCGESGDQESTGYHNCWVRDNIFLAYALHRTDKDGAGTAAAVQVVASIATFFLKYASKFDDIISGKSDKNDPMQRPHIRFNGTHLKENDQEFWNHKQNDALGYFIWMRCRLVNDGAMPLTGDHLRLLGLMMEYLAKIEFWCDEDNGHWEEATKVEASSIGPVLAGVHEFQEVLAQHKGMVAPCSDGVLELLSLRGEEALNQILPNECVQEGKVRDADGALLFLVYPLNIVNDDMAEQIILRVKEKITGSIGIRRYNGDSYWCKDYKDKTGSEATKAYTDEEMKVRDSLVKAGEEAQWCIFDPMLSCIYGKKYAATGDKKFLDQQQLYLSRTLAQITGEDCSFGPWHCPESYYLCKEEWIPNDICPLLWTQANLQVALAEMEVSLTPKSKKRPAASAKGGVLKKPAGKK